VFKAQELKRFGLLAVLCTPVGGKEHEPSFLLGQFQVELREARCQLPLEALGVSLVLKAHHKIVGESDEVGLPVAPTRFRTAWYSPRRSHSLRAGSSFPRFP
jgi:hypothetical protein